MSAAILLLWMLRSPSVDVPVPGGQPLMAALYHLESRAARVGWSAEDVQAVGDLRYRLGDLPGAVAYWSQAGSHDPVRQELLARTYLELGRWPEALDALRDLVGMTPQNAWAHFHLGATLLAFDPHAARHHLEVAASSAAYADEAAPLLEISRSAADDPLVSMRAGTVLAALERWPQAELAFNHAAAVGYPYPEALAYLGLARIRQGKDGTPWLRQAVYLGHDVPAVFYLYGLALRAEGRDEESLQAFIEAVRLDPNNPAYYAELGGAYSLLYQYEQAEYWLQIAAAVSGGSLRFRELLAVFYAQYGANLLSPNLEALRASGSDLPADSALLAGYGWALYSSGETLAGITYINAALDLNPLDAAAVHYQARVLLDQGDIPQARRLIEQLAAGDSVYRAWAQDQLQALVPSDRQEIPDDSSMPQDR